MKEKSMNLLMNTIFQEKESDKKTLKDLNVKYIGIIYRDVLQHKPVKQIHKDLFNATINSKVKSKRLLAYAMKVSNKAKKLDKGKGEYYAIGLGVLADNLYEMFRKENVRKKGNKVIYKHLDDEEHKKKKKVIDDMVEIGRKTDKIWFVCSYHKDSAPDHAPWQGRLFVDRYWHNYDKTGEIGAFIKANNIRTLQWVISKPVWMLTRPNCRHYMVQYSTEDILKGNYQVPIADEGDRGMQVTTRDAKIEDLEQELKMCEEMYKTHPTEKLKARILKIKIIIRRLLTNNH